MGCNGPQTEADAFFANLKSMCGETLVGQITSFDPQDADWRDKTLTITFDPCTAKEVRIPLRVGIDDSRTWIVTSFANSLALRHRHLHADGEEDNVSGYGGTNVTAGSPYRQEFPADRYSRNLFERENIPESSTNVWALEVNPQDGTFAYELQREGRFFRAEFARDG